MRSSRLLSFFVGAIALLGASIWSYAQMSPGQDRYLPYRGRLENGTGALSGMYDFRFALFAGDGSSACIADASCPDDLWTGDRGNVTVSAGSFSVEVGPVPESVLLNHDALRIGIAVRPTGGGDYTALAGRQAILPTPYAARAAAARDYTVTGDLDVGGQVTSDTVSTGDIDVAGGAYFGTTTRQMLNLWSTQYGFGVQAGTLYARSDANFAWFVDGAHAGATLDPGPGGGVLMSLDAAANLHVRGDQEVDGDLIVDGTLAGRVVGGAEAVCTSNSGGLSACRNVWGAGACSGCGVSCSRGAPRYVASYVWCYGPSGWNHSCLSAVCVE